MHINYIKNNYECEIVENTIKKTTKILSIYFQKKVCNVSLSCTVKFFK